MHKMTYGIAACAEIHARTMMWARRRARTETRIYCAVPRVLRTDVNAPFGNDKEDPQAWATEYIRAAMGERVRKAMLP